MRGRTFFAILFMSAALFLSCSLVRAAATTTPEIDVLNQKIQVRKDKIKQLEDTIGKYRQNIAEKQTEGVSLRNQLGILDNRTAQLNADIDLTNEKIQQAQLQIEALNLSIADKERVMAKQKIIIAQLVRGINAEGQKNYLEILLTYQNFSDFYNQLKYQENAYSDLGRSVKALRLIKEDLDSKKQQVQEQKRVYVALKAELDNKKQDLDEQVKLKQDLLLATKSSELKYRTLLASLKQQYQVVENEVQTFEAQIRKKLEEQDKIKMSGDVLMSWPVDGRTITARFHDPDYPFRRVFEHSGTDIRTPQGTPVHAAASGYVARARRCTVSSCYSYVLIVHTGSISSLYGHLSGINVTDDAYVNRGDVIGYSGGIPGTVGAGSFVTGPHLHFEVRLNGMPVDAMGYLVQ